MEKLTMEKIVSFCKQYGFIYQGSELYGGLANTFDYGPLGIELKENLRKAWWKKFVQENPYNVGLQSAILMNPKIWEVSGHLKQATDPLMDCKKCKERFRADKVINEYMKENKINDQADGWNNEKLINYLKEKKIKCPKCQAFDWTDIRDFNIMFKTYQGVTEESQNIVYLRPETAQGMFVNFKNIQRSMRLKIPFGVAQTGKSFRNEITPGNFIFRTREFEQMELEFFCQPGTDLAWFDYYKKFCLDWLIDLGIKKENLDFHDHSKEELCHYSVATTDIIYHYPFGWDELWGIANRTNYDLKNHSQGSKVDLSYLDPETNEKYFPYCVEPALGLDRALLAFLCDSYCEEKLDNGETREILKLHPFLAPYKVSVLPLSKKYHQEKALEIYHKLTKRLMVSYDENGSIGKRYRRQDIIGTPFAITIDNNTLENNEVTIRERDTMEQITLPIEEIVNYLEEKVLF